MAKALFTPFRLKEQGSRTLHDWFLYIEGDIMPSVQQRYEIKKGPSKFDLAFGLFRGSNGGNHEIQFTVLRVNEENGRIHLIPGEKEINVSVRLIGVSREDGSGESWNLWGKTADLGYVKETGFYMKGYFRTDHRTGFIYIEFP